MKARHIVAFVAKSRPKIAPIMANAETFHSSKSVNDCKKAIHTQSASKEISSLFPKALPMKYTAKWISSHCKISS